MGGVQRRAVHVKLRIAALLRVSCSRRSAGSCGWDLPDESVAFGLLRESSCCDGEDGVESQ